MSNVLNEQIQTGSKKRVALKIGLTLLGLFVVAKSFNYKDNLEKKNKGFYY